MNKTELVAAVAAKAGISKKDADAAVAAVFASVTDALANGEKVQLIGFGTFEVRARAEKTARNPKTGETMTVPATKVPAFKAGAPDAEAFGLAGVFGSGGKIAAGIAVVNFGCEDNGRNAKGHTAEQGDQNGPHQIGGSLYGSSFGLGVENRLVTKGSLLRLRIESLGLGCRALVGAAVFAEIGIVINLHTAFFTEHS